MASTNTKLGCLLLTVLTVVSASVGAAALAGTAGAQANEQQDGSPVTVSPGLAGTTNDFTFTMDLSGNSSDVEVESAWLGFDDASGINGTALAERIDNGESEVSVSADGTSVEYWGVYWQSSNGVQIGSSHFTLAEADSYTITITNVPVPNAGEFSATYEMMNDSYGTLSGQTLTDTFEITAETATPAPTATATPTATAASTATPGANETAAPTDTPTPTATATATATPTATATATPTATATATDTPTATPTPESNDGPSEVTDANVDTTSGDGPGMGGLTVVLAIAALAFAATRRE